MVSDASAVRTVVYSSSYTLPAYVRAMLGAGG
jgi:hypothetical protein